MQEKNQKFRKKHRNDIVNELLQPKMKEDETPKT